MRKIFLVGSLLFFCLRSAAQIAAPEKSGKHIILPGLHISYLNTFSTSGHKYSSYNVSMPVSEKFIAYGKQVTVSVLAIDGNIILGEHSGEFFRDTSQTAPLPIADIEVRASRNDTLLFDWTPVTNTTAYTELIASYKQAPEQHPTAYRVFDDSLQNGDSLTVQLRLKQGKPLLTLAIGKKDAYANANPFLMMSRKDTAGVSAVQNPFVAYKEVTRLMDRFKDFRYEDWPTPGLQIKNEEMAAHTNLTLFFRKPEWPYTSMGYEYRVLSSLRHDTTWKKTDGLVGVSDLEEGASYKLEIRYTGQPHRHSEYTFYVPPAWYNSWAFRVMAFALLTAIALFAFFRSAMLRTRRKAEKYRLETKALYAQMNPHFLFNALSSIQGLMNDAQIEKANHYLNGFASLLRGSIQMGNKETIPLAMEIKILENYIQLERLRFNFRYNLQLDPQLPVNEIEVPPLLVQPIIENAVKHGISAKREEGKLILSIYKEQMDLLISVADNGNGFDAHAVHTGYGIKLTQERIHLFNKVHQGKTLVMEMQTPDAGATVILRFKNWLSND